MYLPIHSVLCRWFFLFSFLFFLLFFFKTALPESPATPKGKEKKNRLHEAKYKSDDFQAKRKKKRKKKEEIHIRKFLSGFHTHTMRCDVLIYTKTALKVTENCFQCEDIQTPSSGFTPGRGKYLWRLKICVPGCKSPHSFSRRGAKMLVWMENPSVKNPTNMLTRP